MKIAITIVLAMTLLTTAGCASSQEPAPGTAPGDMSSEEHRQEAQAHDEEAAEHEREAMGSPKTPQKAGHKREAREHSDVADQHDRAADAAEEAEEDD